MSAEVIYQVLVAFCSRDALNDLISLRITLIAAITVCTKHAFCCLVGLSPIHLLFLVGAVRR